jgi:hypothetical protein
MTSTLAASRTPISTPAIGGPSSIVTRVAACPSAFA